LILCLLLVLMLYLRSWMLKINAVYIFCHWPIRYSTEQYISKDNTGPNYIVY